MEKIAATDRPRTKNADEPMEKIGDKRLIGHVWRKLKIGLEKKTRRRIIIRNVQKFLKRRKTETEKTILVDSFHVGIEFFSGEEEGIAVYAFDPNHLMKGTHLYGPKKYVVNFCYSHVGFRIFLM